MTSATSFFNPRVLRKDLSRFAPVWALYTIALVLFGQMMTSSYLEPDGYAISVARSISSFSPVAMLYAGVCALVLFGDLYSGRMCNALHAMPMRREGWFATHSAAGILFGMIPYALQAVIFGMELAAWRSIALYWFAGVMLQHVFFFGLASLSAMCAGTYLGMAAVYAILQFGSAFLYLLVEELYLPLLPGVVMNAGFLEKLAPLYWTMNPLFVENDAGETVLLELQSGQLGRLLTVGGVGLLCSLAAMALYRRRHLERAGDLLAVRALQPVFLVIAALASGLLWNLAAQLFTGNESLTVFFIGLTLGYFVAQMLVKRSTRIFIPRTVGAYVLLAALVGASLYGTSLDPMGQVLRVPQTEEIQSCSLDFLGGADGTEVTDPAQIERVRTIHRALAEAEQPGEVTTDGPATFWQVEVRYHLTDGSELVRRYWADSSTPAGQQVGGYLSRWQHLLGTEDLAELESRIRIAEVYGWESTVLQIPQEAYGEVLEAIAADADAGNLTFPDLRPDTSRFMCSLNFEITEPDGGIRYLGIDVTDNCVHILEALRASGICVEE